MDIYKKANPEHELALNERLCTGTTRTLNKSLEKWGYIVLKRFWNPVELYRPVPVARGMMKYWGKELDQYQYWKDEPQVAGSLATYNYPDYKQYHSLFRLKIERAIGRKLYNTYYYDRFYFDQQELEPHVDRDACEISFTYHVSSNINEDWHIWIKTPDTYDEEGGKEVVEEGEYHAAVLEPGDGLVYKGCERPHWREPMPKGKRGVFNMLNRKKEERYYHQAFFHYVLQDGLRAHCAFDSAR
jgi:hypothetical protein